jgi:hypothetical protein
MMEMPKPTEAHRKMALLAGCWSGQERLHPSPWDPKGGLATGRSENSLGLGDFALLHDYIQERDGVVSFTGHGVLTYDPKERVYSMHWWDSMGCGVNVFKGSFEGKTLNMTHRGPQGHNRVVWEFPTEKTYRFRMEVSPDGNQWHLFMEGEYAKVD